MVGSQGDCVHTLPILTGDCVHTVFTLTYTAVVGSQGDCVHTLPILTGDCVHTVFTLTYTAVVGSQSDCIWIQVSKLYAPIFSGLVSERLINPLPASIFKL